MTIDCRACDVRVQVLHGLREARHVGLLDERLDLRAVQDELAHEVHELVEALRVHADRGGAAVAALLLRRLLGLGGRRSAARRGPAGAAERLGRGDVDLERLDRRGGGR